MDEQPSSRAIATVNHNSAMVQAIIRWRRPGRYGNAMLYGLGDFGVAFLVGAEPAVYLIGRVVRGRTFGGRNHNDNPLITHSVDRWELQRRIRQHLRSLGYEIN